jgi:spermidine synthase
MAQGGSFFLSSDVFATVYHQLSKVFPVVKPCQIFTATYPGGVRHLHVATLGDDPAEVDPAKVAQIRTARSQQLRYYSEVTHPAAFAIPPCVCLPSVHLPSLRVFAIPPRVCHSSVRVISSSFESSFESLF